MTRNKLRLAVSICGACMALGSAVAGCGQSGPSIAGTWTVSEGNDKAVLTCQPNGAFEYKDATGSMKGRWQSDGHNVELFQDVRNGGAFDFGDGGDNAFHYRLSADGKSLTSVNSNPQKGTTVTLVKQG